MFIDEPEPDERSDKMFVGDEKYMGWVLNSSRLWAWQPESLEGLSELIGRVSEGLTPRERGVVAAACAATIADSYCALAWAGKLARDSDTATAVGVLEGSDDGLSERERAMANWARAVCREPNATTQDDVDSLRAAGIDDATIFAVTAFVGLRIAFSTVNDALGTLPDAELRGFAPSEVLDAVDYGRPIAEETP